MARTETVTVVFTDLVSSTELAGRLGHDAYEALRHEHFTALRTAVARHGGTEVKTTGDGLMLRFDSAASAIACAVAMQQATEGAVRRAHRHPLEIRVGVSCGEATHEDGDLFGAPVVEAARLCAAATGGQIVVSDIIRSLARGRGHAFASLGELTLKGLPEPVPACEVNWEPLGAEATGIPLPPRLTTTQTIAMVGRAAEQQVLAAAWAKAKEGQRQLVLVSGEPGIGKTRLASETAHAAHADGGVALFGSCDEDVVLPYRPFVEALRHYVAYAPEDVLEAHVRAHKGELVRLVPELAERVRDLPKPQVAEAETERYLLFEAAAGLLSAASEERPVVLILDDLHWAGTPELLLLKNLVRSSMPLRMLIIATYRDTDLTRTHPFTPVLADLRREANVERIALHGLDDAAVVELVTAAAGHQLTQNGLALAHAIHDETEGSPFFIGEILRNLAESGAIFQEGGQWTFKGDVAGLGIPEGVKEVIGRRLSRLSEQTNKVLSLAAVIGRQFDLALLMRIADVSEDAILDALDQATAAALVAEVPGSADLFSFSHALIRTTLYEELSAARRARLHRRVGEALEELTAKNLDARIDELAHHWLSATQVVDAAKAVRYAQRAGERALAALAASDALRYYAQAVDLYPQVPGADPVLGIDLAIGLGTAQRLTGDPTFRDTLLDAARRAADLRDTHRLVAAALALSWGVFSDAGVIDREKVEILELALDRLPDRTPDRARLLATLCGELSYETALARREALADEAVAIAQSSGDDATIADVLNHVSIALQIPLLFEQSLSRSSEALVRAERAGDPSVLLFAVGIRAEAAAQAGDIEEMDRCLDLEDALNRRLDSAMDRWVLKYRRAMRAQIAGDTDRAEHLATEAFQIGPEGRSTVGAVFGAQMYTVHLLRGTIAEIIPLIEQSAAANPGLPGFKATLARAHSEADCADEARRVLENLAATGFSLAMDQTWLGSMVDAAAVAIDCRDAKYAQVLFDRLAPFAGMFSTIGGAAAQGPVSAYLGGLATVLGRYGEADAYFARSAAMNARMGAKYFAVWTDLQWGKMLAERKAPGDTERARELIRNAQTVAAADKYGTIERRAIEAISHLG